jgi:hypothetical protein
MPLDERTSNLGGFGNEKALTYACTRVDTVRMHVPLQTSARTILCKVQVATPKGRDGVPAVYTDFLSLIQNDDEWVIASKVFAVAPVS